jgi:hypothetical protein
MVVENINARIVALATVNTDAKRVNVENVALGYVIMVVKNINAKIVELVTVSIQE